MKKQHGTRSRYTIGCRCAACRAANAAYIREWMKRRRGTRVPQEPPETQAP